MTDNNNVDPQSLYPPDEDRPEPVENTPIDEAESITVTEEELTELGTFLDGIRQVVVAHETRITNIEKFILEAIGVTNAVDPSEGEGTGAEVPADGESKTTIVDGSGKPLDTGGTEVPEQDS